MPNTKSAERRVRSNERKRQRNQSVKSRLKTLEKSYVNLVETGAKEEAQTALREVTGALDKAAKIRVIHRNTASRRKSRLTVRLAATKA